MKWLLLAIPLLMACGPEPEADEEPVVVDPCTDDHVMAFSVTDNAYIGIGDLGAPVVPADQACNSIQWHNGGGFQGGDTYHIEPVVMVTDPQGDYSIYWELWLDGVLMNSQGFEIYPQEWTDEGEGTRSYRSIFLISPNVRGKNVELKGFIQPIGVDAQEMTAKMLVVAPT